MGLFLRQLFFFFSATVALSEVCTADLSDDVSVLMQTGLRHVHLGSPDPDLVLLDSKDGEEVNPKAQANARAKERLAKRIKVGNLKAGLMKQLRKSKPGLASDFEKLFKLMAHTAKMGMRCEKNKSVGHSLMKRGEGDEQTCEIVDEFYEADDEMGDEEEEDLLMELEAHAESSE